MIESAFLTLVAGEALAAKRRVKLSGITAVYAGVTEIGIGVTEFAAAINEDVTIRLDNGGGTMEITAAGQIAAGAPFYPAALGKITGMVGGLPLGFALAAASQDGDIINVLRTTVAGELTLGDMICGGLVDGQTAFQGLCVSQTVQNCLISSRRITWDGRVFRYSLAGARCDTYIANIFYNSIGTGAGDVGIDWSALAANAGIGATSVVMTNQGGHAIAKDALFGGNLVLNPTDGTNNHLIQQRRVTGNTAATANGLCTISFAEPLVRALTAGTSYGYVMPSPYSDIRANQLYQTGKVSVAGYAAGECDVAGKYHWEQTWGAIACSLYGDAVGKSQYKRDVVFRFDGNLIHRAASGVTGLEAQRAGFIMDNNGADNGATMIMLMLDR